MSNATEELYYVVWVEDGQVRTEPDDGYYTEWPPQFAYDEEYGPIVSMDDDRVTSATEDSPVHVLVSEVQEARDDEVPEMWRALVAAVCEERERLDRLAIDRMLPGPGGKGIVKCSPTGRLTGAVTGDLADVNTWEWSAEAKKVRAEVASEEGAS